MRPGVRGGKQLLCAVVSLWGICALATGVTGHAANVYPEESVKAEFLLRFTGYVEWPQRPQPGSNFVVAVLGANDVATHLEKLAAGRQVMGVPVQVRRISSAAEGRDAHVLYLASLRADRLRAAMRILGERSVLVVTDDENGLAGGGVINFLRADKRVRFEVSRGAARKAQLRISSDLLSVAARVTE